MPNSHLAALVGLSHTWTAVILSINAVKGSNCTWRWPRSDRAYLDLQSTSNVQPSSCEINACEICFTTFLLHQNVALKTYHIRLRTQLMRAALEGRISPSSDHIHKLALRPGYQVSGGVVLSGSFVELLPLFDILKLSIFFFLKGGITKKGIKYNTVPSISIPQGRISFM